MSSSTSTSRVVIVAWWPEHGSVRRFMISGSSPESKMRIQEEAERVRVLDIVGRDETPRPLEDHEI
jgi:hypothetical protein